MRVSGGCRTQSAARAFIHEDFPAPEEAPMSHDPPQASRSGRSIARPWMSNPGRVRPSTAGYQPRASSNGSRHRKVNRAVRWERTSTTQRRHHRVEANRSAWAASSAVVWPTAAHTRTRTPSRRRNEPTGRPRTARSCGTCSTCSKAFTFSPGPGLFRASRSRRTATPQERQILAHCQRITIRRQSPVATRNQPAGMAATRSTSARRTRRPIIAGPRTSTGGRAGCNRRRW